MHFDETTAQAIQRSLDFLRQVLNLPDPVDPELQKLCKEPATPVVDIVQSSWPQVIHAMKDVQNFAPGGFTLIGPGAESATPNVDRPLFQTPGPGWISVLMEMTINLIPAAADAAFALILRSVANSTLPGPAMTLRVLGAPIGAARTYLSQGGVSAALFSAGLRDESALLFRPVSVVPFGFSLAAQLTGAAAVGNFQFYVQHIPPGLSLPY